MNKRCLHKNIEQSAITYKDIIKAIGKVFSMSVGINLLLLFVINLDSNREVL